MFPEKTKQAVHYICACACEDGLQLGATRLNKVLWFAQRENYLRTLRPMLAIPFVKGPYGPFPPDRQEICNELAASGAISVQTRSLGEYTLTEFRSLREPDTSELSEEERFLLRALTREICTEYTARSISELTHNSLYDMLSMGEEYPIQLCLAERARPATPEEVDDILREVEAHPETNVAANAAATVSAEG